MTNLIKVIVALLLFVHVTSPAEAQSSPGPVQEIVVSVPKPDPGPSVFRSPAAPVPMRAFLLSESSGMLINVVPSYSLGLVDVEIENLDTGDCVSRAVLMQASVFVPVSNLPGRYLVTFALPDGREYQGEYEI